MNQEEMLDRLGIERLVYQYANAVDELDRQAFADCFAEGAVVVSPGVTLEGDFAGTVMDVLEKHYVYTMHNVQNRRYTVQDDRATGVTYCLASHVSLKDGAASKLDWYIRYHDELVKRGGRWFILKRRLELMFTTTVPTVIVGDISTRRKKA